MTRDEKKLALTEKGVEFKGNISNVDLDALYTEHIGELPVEEPKEEKTKVKTKIFVQDGVTYRKTYNERGDALKCEVIE